MELKYKSCVFNLSINNDKKLLAGRGGEATLCAQTVSAYQFKHNQTYHFTKITATHGGHLTANSSGQLPTFESI